MSPKPPERIDRATFDRVLRRAAELQSGGRELSDGGMTEAEVLALGQEVGLSEAQLRQALLEERVRATPLGEPTMLDRMIAPAEFQAERVVQGTPEMVGAALTKWLERHEHVVPQRTTLERITYEPMHSFAGALRKAGAIFDPSRGKPYLDNTDRIDAVITPLEDGFCHVTLAASFRKRRSAFIGGGAALASLGVAGAAVVGALLPAGDMAPMLFPLLPGLAAGWFTARAYRPSAERAGIGLERTLDALEQNPALPPGQRAQLPKSAVLGREVGEAVREFTKEVRKALDK